MKTLVLGASPNPSRYSYLAIKTLLAHHHEVVAVGNHEGVVDDIPILPQIPANQQIDTVTMYMNVAHQRLFYSQILEAKPRRIIFNPGAENSELGKLAQEAGILTENSCTLVLLNTGQY